MAKTLRISSFTENHDVPVLNRWADSIDVRIGAAEKLLRNFLNFHVFTVKNSKVGINTSSPTSVLHVTGVPVFANNAAAIAGGLTAGAFYRTGGDPDLVSIVH